MGLLSSVAGGHYLRGPEVSNFQPKIFGPKFPETKFLLCNVSIENKSYWIFFLVTASKNGPYVVNHQRGRKANQTLFAFWCITFLQIEFLPKIFCKSCSKPSVECFAKNSTKI